jgi:hypothetical protein
MTWVVGLAVVGAAILVCFVWDLVVRGGKLCAQLVDHFVLFPRVRARRRAGKNRRLQRMRKLSSGPHLLLIKRR